MRTSELGLILSAMSNTSRELAYNHRQADAGNSSLLHALADIFHVGATTALNLAKERSLNQESDNED